MSNPVDELVAAIRDAMPTVERLRAAGLGEEEARLIRASSSVIPRPTPAAGPHRHAFDELFARFDCASLELRGQITLGVTIFDERLVGSKIGMWEADPIVVRDDGEVVCLDHADLGHVVVRCARDPERFLRALTRVVRECADDSSWGARRQELVAECARIAGGDEYLAFYEGMI